MVAVFTAFKQHSNLAPPLRFKWHALLVVPRAYDLVTGRYVFIMIFYVLVPHLTPFAMLLAGGYTPLPKG